MTFISSASLFTLAIVCLFGVFSPIYKDNWCQFFGLWGLIAWSLARGFQVVETGDVSTQQLIAHVSLALFAVGTAWKVVKLNRQERDDLASLTDEELRQIYGRGES